MNQRSYELIEKAIKFIAQNYRDQPSLEQIADSVNLGPTHFQKTFTAWAGISPKKFVKYLSAEYAKKLLRENNLSILEATYEAGLTAPSRLHDLFVSIEAMTPGEYKNGGASLSINYSLADSLFGQVLIASTSRGVCHMSFETDFEKGLKSLKERYPNASFSQHLDSIQQEALFIFQKDWSKLSQIKLHLRGTPFQLKVWSALLKIPQGKLSSYGELAKAIGDKSAARAVGSAVGKNPIAYLIPCHRVIRSTGEFGEYMWGAERKTVILGWDLAKGDEEP